MRLYRAVTAVELGDLAAKRSFDNPPGIEVKYFTTRVEDARRYAELASAAFGEGPFAIVETSIETFELSEQMHVLADGIRCIVVPTDLLSSLTTPNVVAKD